MRTLFHHDNGQNPVCPTRIVRAHSSRATFYHYIHAAFHLWPALWYGIMIYSSLSTPAAYSLYMHYPLYPVRLEIVNTRLVVLCTLPRLPRILQLTSSSERRCPHVEKPLALSSLVPQNPLWRPAAARTVHRISIRAHRDSSHFCRRHSACASFFTICRGAA